MSEMVERVAKAIYECWAKDRCCNVPWHEVESLKHSVGNLARAEARAAIEAMHEPTEDMLFVGSNEDAGYSDNDLRISWQLMIDEALK